MMIPLVSLVATASATGAALAMCSAKNRQAPTRKSSKSTKSKRSSSKSARSASKSRRSGKSKKSRKSSKEPKRAKGSTEKSEKSKKSKRKSKKSKKSGKSGKSSESGKSSKKCQAKQCEKKKRQSTAVAAAVAAPTSDATSKSAKEQKSSKSGSHSGEEKILKMVPNDSHYAFAEGQVKPSTLRASPNKLPFAPSGGVQSVVISNSTKSRKAFKVKTSDNMLYRVNPVYGFVEPGGQASIDVLRHNGAKKTDNLVVLTSNASAENACAKSVFDSDPARELTVIPLVAH